MAAQIGQNQQHQVQQQQLQQQGQVQHQQQQQQVQQQAQTLQALTDLAAQQPEISLGQALQMLQSAQSAGQISAGQMSAVQQ